MNPNENSKKLVYLTVKKKNILKIVMSVTLLNRIKRLLQIVSGMDPVAVMSDDSLLNFHNPLLLVLNWMNLFSHSIKGLWSFLY